jgi:hypothetical protein
MRDWMAWRLPYVTAMVRTVFFEGVVDFGSAWYFRRVLTRRGPPFWQAICFFVVVDVVRSC